MGRVKDQPCPDGFVRDKVTKECRESKRPRKKLPCPDGMVRNTQTKECRERKKPGPQKTTIMALNTTDLQQIPSTTPCHRVMTLTQVTGTCWFNALMMGIFYSQGMRAVVLNAMPKWKTKVRETRLKVVYDSFRDIVLTKFLYKTGNWSKKAIRDLEANAKAFQFIFPDHILSMLNKLDQQEFYNQGMGQPQRGGMGHAYIQALFKLLHVTNYTMVDEYKLVGTHLKMYHKSRLYGLTFDKHPETHRTRSTFDPARYLRGRPKPKPDLLLIRRGYQEQPDFQTQPLAYPMHKVSDTIYIYNGKNYIIDSMYLANFNYDVCQKSHAIAGITCSNKRYLYNGWTRDTMNSGIIGRQENKVACPLMDIDWALDMDMCINRKVCDMDSTEGQSPSTMCFNPHKGSRFLIAVREDLYQQGFEYNRALSAPASALNKVCPDRTKSYNPASKKRCEDISLSVYFKENGFHLIQAAEP